MIKILSVIIICVAVVVIGISQNRSFGTLPLVTKPKAKRSATSEPLMEDSPK